MDTSSSLLDRLRHPADRKAWERFVELYTPLLYYWARRAGLQDADAADLVQEVLVLLFRLPEVPVWAALSEEVATNSPQEEW